MSHPVDLGQTIAELQERFLRAPREPDEAPPPSPWRWYRMSAMEAERHEPDRWFRTGPERREPVRASPARLDQATLLHARTQRLLEAETSARAFAARVWGARGLSDPPKQVIWRLSGWGSQVSGTISSRPPYLEGFEDLFGFHPRPRWRYVDPQLWTPAFNVVARYATLEEDWEHGVREGWVRGENPVTPLLDVWRSGVGLMAMTAECLVLFVSQRDSAPVLLSTVSSPLEQRKRDEAVEFTARVSDLSESLSRLLRSGGRPGPTEHYSPLHALAYRTGRWIAADHGAHGFDPTDPERRAIVSEFVAILLEAGADPGARFGSRGSALYERVSHGHSLDPSCFLEGGYPLEALDSQGRTALHQAVEFNNPQALAWLLAAGARPDVQDRAGFTALHLALATRRPTLAEALLEAGANPHLCTGDGRTAYHFAAYGLLPEEVQAWVDRLESLSVQNLRDGCGWTPADLGPPGIRWPPVREGEALEIRSLARPPIDLLARLDGAEAWAVLGDWLQAQGDVRGELVALALAEERAAVATGRLAARRAAVIGPLWGSLRQAHPLGAFLPEGAVQEERGVARGFDGARAAGCDAAFPDLLASPLLNLLDRVELTLYRDERIHEVLAKGPYPWRELRITSEDRGRRLPQLSLELEQLPLLKKLVVRQTLARPLRLAHPGLVHLEVAHAYEPDLPVVPPGELDLPGLQRLSLTFCRAPRPQSEVWAWMKELFQSPPPGLHWLELRPASIAVLDALVQTPILDQLESLVLSSARGELIGRLEELSERLTRLQRIRVSALGLGADGRREAGERLRRVLPQVRVEGRDYRNVGDF